MVTPRKSTHPTTNPSTSSLFPSGSSSEVVSSSVRSRNRRPASATQFAGNRATSPPNTTANSTPNSHPGSLSFGRTAHRGTGSSSVRQFLGDSLAQSWNSVQELATAFLSVSDDLHRGKGSSRGSALPADHRLHRSSTGHQSITWGPAPPTRESTVRDAPVGLVHNPEATPRTVLKASMWEGRVDAHGGLDVSGRHKRRSSIDSRHREPLAEDYPVYIHHVQPEDTYAGLILRYRCREDIFRKANGLWSGDSIQTRKWLALPVDACDIRGRLCESGPAGHELLESDLVRSRDERSQPEPEADDLRSFGGCTSEDEVGKNRAEDEEEPWTHVCWVHLDSLPQPVQICRVTKQILGYFPPRRKRSFKTTSSLSTPRQSSDVSQEMLAASGSTPHRRQSEQSTHPISCRSSVPLHSHKGNEAVDRRPAWMRRPGGVGPINTHEPGPEGDYLNSWATKHLPSLNIGGLPSMSVMGSETASFGFAPESSRIVESPFAEGHDTTSFARQGSSLDRAAAAVESWLRVALTRRPNTPVVGQRNGQMDMSITQSEGDLIELANKGLEASSANRPR